LANGKTSLFITKILPALLILLPITVLSTTTQILAENSLHSGENPPFEPTGAKGIITYTPKFNALNFEGPMTLTPIFTPDNALDVYAAWIAKANDTIDIQNQYITQFDGDPWSTDSHPVVRGIVDAAVNRSVTVRVQINEDGDSDDVTSYLNGISGITVRWMGTSGTDSGDGYLSNTHNKLVIIDGSRVLTLARMLLQITVKPGWLFSLKRLPITLRLFLNRIGMMGSHRRELTRNQRNRSE
jgi:hypothetical protein